MPVNYDLTADQVLRILGKNGMKTLNGVRKMIIIFILRFQRRTGINTLKIILLQGLVMVQVL